ncbi:MAG: hypothetical protein ACE5G3_05845, partial [Gammaproteobacteria bacterium]
MASSMPPDHRAGDLGSDDAAGVPAEASASQAAPEDAVDDPRLLPFSFAKRHGLLIKGFEAGKAQMLVRED